MNEEIENLLHRENMTLASIQKRSLAFFIDEVLLSLLLMVVLWDTFIEAKTTEDIIYVVNSFVLEFMFIKIFYQSFFVMKYGASLGKIAMKIRVIEVQTLQTPNVIVSLNRGIFRVVGELFFYFGFLWGLLDPARQALHDKTAKTLVIDA